MVVGSTKYIIAGSKSCLTLWTSKNVFKQKTKTGRMRKSELKMKENRKKPEMGTSSNLIDCPAACDRETKSGN